MEKLTQEENTQMVIRKAAASDIEELVRLRVLFLDEVNGPGSMPEGFAELMRAYFTQAFADGSFAAWLAEENGGIVATSGVCYYRLAPNYSNPSSGVAYILNIFTLPEYRRLGLASQLIGRIIGEAGEKGYRRLALHATEQGRKVYEKFGFEATDDEMVKYL